MTDEKYPEHAKLRAIQVESQAIGQFIDWLSGEGVQLMKWTTDPEGAICPSIKCDDGWIEVKVGERDYERRPHGQCNGTGMVPKDGWAPYLTGGITRFLERYFEIDGDVLEAEKRAMLDEIRAMHDA